MITAYFAHYKNAEFVQFTDNVLSIVRKNDPVTLKIEPQAGHLEERYNVLKKLFIIDQGNAITQEIQQYDAHRDNDLIGINLAVDAYERHFAEEKRKASALLRKLLDKYGRDLYKRSYPEETAGIRNMTDEIRKSPKLTAAVATLGLTEWFADLDQVNNLFDKKYLERNEAYAEAPKEKFADVRKETEEAYEEMIKHLNAHSVINPDKAYDKVIAQIDQLTKSYNQSARGGNSSSGPDTTE